MNTEIQILKNMHSLKIGMGGIIELFTWPKKIFKYITDYGCNLLDMHFHSITYFFFLKEKKILLRSLTYVRAEKVLFLDEISKWRENVFRSPEFEITFFSWYSVCMCLSLSA